MLSSLNTSIQESNDNILDQVLQKINISTEYINEICQFDIICKNEQQIIAKTISTKQLINKFFKSIHNFTSTEWVKFIKTYINNVDIIDSFDKEKLDKVINEFRNKLKQEITVSVLQKQIDDFILYNTKFFDVVYKFNAEGYNKSDYTKIGKQYLDKIYDECVKLIQNNSEIQNILSLVCNTHGVTDINLRIVDDVLYSLISSVITAYIHNINDNWEIYQIEYFIRKALILLVPRIKKELITNDFSNMANKIIQAIRNNLNNILPNIQFRKLPNGYYKYSWLDTHQYNRFDADVLLKYIKNNKDIANSLIKEALNIDLNEFQQKYKIRWNNFIYALINYPYVIEKLHLLVRKYIVDLNRDIVLQKSNEINKINDNNKIISIDNDGNLRDTEGKIIDDSSKDKLILDFDPRNDEQRERPLVIIREWLSDNKNDYKDHIKVGRRGENHGSVLERYSLLVNKSIFPSETNPTFAYAYVIGKICVIDNRRGFFPSVIEVRDSIKKSGKFSKIYIMPNKEPVLFRLARKI